MIRRPQRTAPTNPTRQRGRPGHVNLAWLSFLASFLAFVALVGILVWDHLADRGTPAGQPLVVYCAAGLKRPVEAVAREYQNRYGVPVEVQYGGSQTLLATIETHRSGDLYLAADDSYVKIGRDKGLLAETLDLARQTLVVAVKEGNPKKIRKLDDLLAEGVRLSFANPEAAAAGKVGRDALRKAGHWDAVRQRIVVFKPTVTDVASDISVGAVDAGVVWDATVRQTAGLESVPLPELAGASSRVAVALLRATTQPTAALRFARFLAARDAGLPAFREEGFAVVDGDRWAEEPELRLLAGAMLRPAIQETITAFEEREGVRVKCIYNGCGILVAQMRTGEHPDAYFACDQSFMDMVHDLFLGPTPVSTNRLVILVPKGNPHDIRTLADLARPGLRVGVGHEKQCALGMLTEKTLSETGTLGQVRKNVKVQSPTGDMLVNQLLTGSLDAVVAYVSNAAESADRLEAIPVDVACAVAVQPLAVGKDSDFKQLAGRLAEALRSAESRQRFEAKGFRWQEGPR
jgi:molybdenum ABC transporter molybdate-binding protein